MENPNYYAIIPADVRYNEHLTPTAKLLYGEITALCSKKGYCFATNQYFAELYKISRETVSRLIASLVKQNYIKSEMQYDEEHKNITGRVLTLTSTLLTLASTPIDENVKGGIDENVKENNTSNNNIYPPISPQGGIAGEEKPCLEHRNAKVARFKELIQRRCSNETLCNTILDFMEMRKTIKKPMSEQALTLLMNKLDKLASSDEEKIEILEQSILNSWQGIFPLRENNTRFQQQKEDPELARLQAELFSMVE